MGERCGKTMCCSHDCEDCYPIGYVETSEQNKLSKISLNTQYGKNPLPKPSNEYYNALLEAVYYKQIIEEACNGDDPNNHFRENMSLNDCVISFEASKMWTNYAMDYCL